MKCPWCKEIIDKIRIKSTCWQWAYLEGEEIRDYGEIISVGGALEKQCPECRKEISDFIKKGDWLGRRRL